MHQNMTGGAWHGRADPWTTCAPAERACTDAIESPRKWPPHKAGPVMGVPVNNYNTLWQQRNNGDHRPAGNHNHAETCKCARSSATCKSVAS